jgi:predicted secreted protein
MSPPTLIGAVAPIVIATSIGHMALAQPPLSPITVIDDGTAGASVQLPLRRDLEVTLAANPTTGYTWHFHAAGAARLRLKSRSFQAAGSPQRLGAGGMQVFVFEPISAGAEDLRFEYRRGTAGAPARTYRLTVTIVP